jgi:ribosomal 30S subunit maturation factor RimM
VEVLHQRGGETSWVIGIANCHDRDSAMQLVGRYLGFPRESYLEAEFPKPAGGLPFRYLEREVQLTSGEVLGKVAEVRRYGTQITLVIPRSEREILIPAVDPILLDDAGLSGPLVVDPPEGLLDVAGD